MIAVFAAMLVCALPLSAQAGEEGQTASMGVQHAEIGIFDHVDVSGVVTTSFRTDDGEYIHREFVTDPTTAVEGLGGIDEVSEISPDIHGRVVVVQFERDGDHPMARTLRFPTAREIRVTRGSITKMDRESHQLTLRNDEGTTQMDLDIGYGVTVDDTQEGLIPLDDLEMGQSVAVYYANAEGLTTDADRAKTAYLIVRAG